MHETRKKLEVRFGCLRSGSVLCSRLKTRIDRVRDFKTRLDSTRIEFEKKRFGLRTHAYDMDVI